MTSVEGVDMVEVDTSFEVDETSAQGFGVDAELRELAQQRRFVRESAPPPHAAAPTTAPARMRNMGISSRDAATMFAELSGTVAQLASAREEVARQRARAEHADAQLGSVNERLMAARALVQDAQRVARMSAERCAWLEGRNDALEDALDRAVNASMLTRWRWRRQLVRERLGAGEAG